MEVYFLSLSRFWVVLGSWVVDRSMDGWIDALLLLRELVLLYLSALWRADLSVPCL